MPGPVAPVPIPPDAVLVHIGPHKTGTTSLQGALHRARPLLAEHGVHYPGRERSQAKAVLAVTGRPPVRGEARPDQAQWDALVADVRAHDGQRVMISSERFASTPSERIPRIVADLGDDRVHIVVTLRPLARILPAQWQQYVQSGRTLPYERWLKHVFDRVPEGAPTLGFWVRHAHDRLVQRWAAVVGPHRLTVVVLDDQDRQMLTRSFERLLDLPEGLLKPGYSNQSLSAGTIEVVRLINQEFRERHWSDADYARYVRSGFVRGVRSLPRSDGEARLVTPEWALQRAIEVGAAAAAAIEASGVNIVGDLSLLSRPPQTPSGPAPEDPPMPASVVARGLAGTIAVSRRTGRRVAPRPEVAPLRTSTLVRMLAGRVARKLHLRG